MRRLRCRCPFFFFLFISLAVAEHATSLLSPPRLRIDSVQLLMSPVDTAAVGRKSQPDAARLLQSGCRVAPPARGGRKPIKRRRSSAGRRVQREHQMRRRSRGLPPTASRHGGARRGTETKGQRTTSARRVITRCHWQLFAHKSELDR